MDLVQKTLETAGTVPYALLEINLGHPLAGPSHKLGGLGQSRLNKHRSHDYNYHAGNLWGGISGCA